MRRSRCPELRRTWAALLALSSGLSSAAAALPATAMGSPWWENYERRDTYRCPDQRMLVLERNDSQASLLSGRVRSTFFREAGDAPGVRYQSGRLRLILEGDALTLEELPQRLTCVRTEEV
jgi:hypothetical protein